MTTKHLTATEALPMMASSIPSHTHYSGTETSGGGGIYTPDMNPGLAGHLKARINQEWENTQALKKPLFDTLNALHIDLIKQKEQEKMALPTSGLRLVQVFIADTDKRLPIEDRILFRGDQKVTDATDQDLFYEIPIKDLIDKHNDHRKSLLDEEASNKFGRDIFLKPIAIRELTMTVVTVASF